jgi:hypothetical protein
MKKIDSVIQQITDARKALQKKDETTKPKQMKVSAKRLPPKAKTMEALMPPAAVAL